MLIFEIYDLARFKKGLNVESFDIITFLKRAVKAGASDEHLRVGHPPYLRKNGFVQKTNLSPLTKDELENAFMTIATNLSKDDLIKPDIDFMFEIDGFSRFRVNYSKQVGDPALVIRNIPYKVPTPDELFLPETLYDTINYSNGIIIVTGQTGSGKSTTIASLINQINTLQAKHIVTIEDPIEYVFKSKKSIISQRQAEVDTPSFSSGLKYALRQDPDVIFLGEIRDAETMSAALKASETGHLVLTTLHTNDAVQTINKIINMFDTASRDYIRKQLADTLRVVIAQKLVYSNSLNKRFPACEVVVITSTIRDYIIKGNTDEIYKLMNENVVDDMISMNLSLARLVELGKISEEEALQSSNEPNELQKIFSGVYQGTKTYYE